MVSKFGICQWRIPPRYFDREIEWVSHLGLEGVSLELGNDIDDYPLSQHLLQEKYIFLKEKWNLSYPSLGVGVLAKYGMSIKTHEYKVRQAIQAALHAAHALEIPIIQLPSFGNSYINSKDDLVNTINCLRFACGEAEQFGILVETENILSPLDQIALIEEVASPNLRICFDTRNGFSIKQYNVAKLLEKLFPYVSEVHLKDGLDNLKYTGLGSGNSGFFETLEVLKGFSYSGWFLLENDYQMISNDTGISTEELILKDVETTKSYLIT